MVGVGTSGLGSALKRSVRRLLIVSAIGLLAVLSLPVPALAIDEFAAPGGPTGITTGPDGAIWFTGETGNTIGRMTTDGALTNQIPVPTARQSPRRDRGRPRREDVVHRVPAATRSGASTASRASASSRFRARVATPTASSPGPDNALWFTQFGSNQVGRIPTNATCGSGSSITEISTGSGPSDIALGPDGGLWFTESLANNIRRIDPISRTLLPTPFPVPNGGEPSGITSSGGGLWFTQSSSNEIGRITTGGAITEFGPTGTDPSTIATGPDGAIWFTQSLGNQVGRMTTSGSITNQFSLAAPSEPSGITAGPDSALWFTQKLGNKIGRIAVTPPFVPPPPPPPAGPAVATKKKCKVPKLRRLTVKKARKKLKRAGCKYRIRGKGRFSSSKPKAGRTTSGTVTVKFKKAKKKRR